MILKKPNIKNKKKQLLKVKPDNYSIIQVISKPISKYPYVSETLSFYSDDKIMGGIN